MLTLAIGDLYIPDRSIEIPPKFQKLLSPNPNSIPSNNKISQVLCLGNITNSFETLQFLYNLSPSFQLIKGEFDDPLILSQQLNHLNNEESNQTLPNYKIIILDNLKIGFTNGYQIVPKNDPLSLLNLARELDVDVLICGGTHKVEAYILDGKFFINPGSATGAFNFDWPNDEDEEEDEEEEDEEEEKEEQEEKEVKEEIESKPVQANEDKHSEIPESEEPIEKENQLDSQDQQEQNQDEENNDNKHEQEQEPQKEHDNNTTTQDEVFTKEELNQIEELVTNIPSFCLLDTHDNTCTLYIYTYLNEEVKVDKVTYQKE